MLLDGNGFSQGFDAGFGHDGTTRHGLYGGPRGLYGDFLLKVAQPVVTLSTTITDEAGIKAGGDTIVLTVSNDTWVATGAAFNAQRQNIIDGLTSAGVEALGWNAEVRDKEVVTAVARTSDTVVTITLTAAAAYDITANETITATVAATALTGAAETVATPTFTVSYVAAVEERPGGGRGSKKAKSKYPRRVVIDGVIYWVNSAAEERALLAKYQAKVEADALMLAVSDAPEEAVKRAKVRVKRAQARIEAVDTREDEWLQRLRDEDEDILMVVLH